MSLFSCAGQSSALEETMAGTADHNRIFVFIECPLPWPRDALSSSHLPAELQQFIGRAPGYIRFFCIQPGQHSARYIESSLLLQRPLFNKSSVSLLIYRQPEVEEYSHRLQRFSHDYRGYEYRLPSMQDVLPCLRQTLCSDWDSEMAKSGELPSACVSQIQLSDVQDLFVCTHGMRDRCCARLGQPFFREINSYLQTDFVQSAMGAGIAPDLPVPQIRLWKVSHIGGHRFAPTAIVFPSGRVYGRLDLAAVRQLLLRAGPLSMIKDTYRGWSLLPRPVQILEHYLFLQIGWSWLERSIIYEWENSGLSGDDFRVSLTTKQTYKGHSTVVTYRALIARDLNMSCTLRPSCDQTQPVPIIKYSVVDCVAQPVLEGFADEAVFTQTV